MKLQPIVYVTDMERSIAWYSALLDSQPAYASSHWTSFPVAGGTLALHLTDEAITSGGVELSLVTEVPLEAVQTRVEVSRGIADEAFGRSLVVHDPDGTSIQVNEHDAELYSG